MSPVKKRPLSADEPGKQRPAEGQDTAAPAAAAHDPWKYADAVYNMNRGLPHALDFPAGLA